MNNFIKKFNCPEHFFETLGYITVIIGLIIMLIGIVSLPFTCSSHGANNGAASTGGGLGFAGILSGLIIAVVCPQLFFAIAKVVKAAEKYLGE